MRAIGAVILYKTIPELSINMILPIAIDFALRKSGRVLREIPSLYDAVIN